MADHVKPTEQTRMILAAAEETGYGPSALAAYLGVTKNTVIGVLHRAGGFSFAKPSATFTPTRNPFPEEPGRCLYPSEHDTDDDRFHFCGAKVSEVGSPWCARHRRKVFTRASREEEPVANMLPYRG